MLGLMQDRPLLISQLITHAAINHSDREIVTVTVAEGVHRYDYAACERRSRQLAKALIGRGIRLGDRVATLAWNGYRHLEVWFGAAGMGAVAHTVNPRLFDDQITYIINHAEDRLVFADLTFVPLLERLADKLSSVEAFVILCDDAHLPETGLRGAQSYEAFLDEADDDFDWPEFDENTAAGLCYTSGTTGNPKGVLYSNRSSVLHAYGTALVDVLGMGERDTIMPVVPMFHANAWGIPHAAPLVGSKLVLPGADLDGPSLQSLIEREGVTLSAAVPTVWLGLLSYLEQAGKRVDSLKRVVIGGSAAPRSMIERFETKYDVRVKHAWGMTEMNPLGTVNTPKAKHSELPLEQRIDIKCKQGRPVFGVEMKITDDDGNELARDGKAFGHLKVRGPWVVKNYFKHEDEPLLDEGGWFDTGDVATIDPDGYMQITDRSKDVIKSGGEWISSIDLENAAMGHPKVAEAAVIGVPHPKWDERPLLIVVPVKGEAVSKAELLDYLKGQVAKWWLPDDVVFVDQLPHTATGKLMKTALREAYKDYKLPTARDPVS
ncbi:MAG: long-chain-fatty-acid--CoA ligase [Alphaproteobacteria bacterium]|nr:MAG: long-chain-fatty-acid--CoA ligase [Alphaproteobacteria bacterium]